MAWIACYEPILVEGEADPTKRGFATKEEAEDYVRSLICESCEEEMSSHNMTDKMQTGCAAEWLIMEEDAFDNAKTHRERMEAAGYKLIYEKPDTMIMPKSLLFDYHNYRKDMVCPLCNRKVWIGVDENGKESICQKCYLESYE